MNMPSRPDSSRSLRSVSDWRNADWRTRDRRIGDWRNGRRIGDRRNGEWRNGDWDVAAALMKGSFR
jgi:hypothetical protein